MEAKELEQLLVTILTESKYRDNPLYEMTLIERIESFEANGVFTNNPGLVLTDCEGHEFQLTIVRSR